MQPICVKTVTGAGYLPGYWGLAGGERAVLKVIPSRSPGLWGHLLELAAPEAYGGAVRVPWRMESLPAPPENWQMTVTNRRRNPVYGDQPPAEACV